MQHNVQTLINLRELREEVIPNLRDFITYYQSQEMLNFGINIYLLKILKNAKLIFITDNVSFESFITKHKAELQQNNPLDLLQVKDNKYYISLEDYVNDILKCVGEINFDLISANELISGDYKDAKKIFNGFNLANQEMFLAYAFSYDLGFLNGKSHYQNIIEQTKNNKQISNFMGMDDPYWPMQQITSLPLFASEAFAATTSVQNKLFSGAGFFYNILKKNISCVVAIGICDPEKLLNQKRLDFKAYFRGKGLYVLNDNDTTITITTTSANKTNDTNGYFEYELTCEFIFRDKNGELLNKQTHLIHVIHIEVFDGHAISLNNLQHFKLIHKLSLMLGKQEGLLVHCGRGLGRTGQKIAEILGFHRSLLINLFKNKELSREDLNKQIILYVEELRSYRAGLILEYIQFYKFFQNAYNNVVMYELLARQFLKNKQEATGEQPSKRLKQSVSQLFPERHIEPQQPQGSEEVKKGSNLSF